VKRYPSTPAKKNRVHLDSIFLARDGLVQSPGFARHNVAGFGVAIEEKKSSRRLFF
jgi:hypothetical protein